MKTRNEGRLLFGGAQRLARELLTETGDAHRAFEQLAMTLVQEGTPAQLAGALAAAALDAVLDDAAADAPVAAAGVVHLSETAVEWAARELHADNYRDRDATTDAHAADMWPRLLDVERADWRAKAERVLRAAAGAGVDFTTAGPPHPTAAARARAAAEQLPTVGRWPG